MKGRSIIIGVRFAVLAALAGTVGCANRNTAAATPAAVVEVRLRVHNNLNIPLSLSASHAAAVIWNGSVAPNATNEPAVVAKLPLGSIILLRASTAQGAVVSSRDNVVVGEGIVIWTIP